MAPPRVAVATSGGRDSTALLHATLRAARGTGIEVWALHVHHGLMPQADDWQAAVRAQARRWGARFDSRRLQTRPASGDSVEAWARQQRYAALADLARQAGCTLVLLAHHRQDQAETWLLQALRGAGDAGLAAMPREAVRDGITWARPWLTRPRAEIDAYVRRHRLRPLEDDSNHDPRFARSRLRTMLWPVLTRSFEDAETSLAAAALHAQESLALAHEVAQADLAICASGGALAVKPWLALTPARRGNLLRTWLAQALGTPAPRSLVLRLLDEVPQVSSGTWPAPNAVLGLHRGQLMVLPAVGGGALGTQAPACLDLHKPCRLALPEWGGTLVVRRTRSGGAPSVLLSAVVAHARSGGERFAFAPQATARSLKKQFQARTVPAWDREGPLLSTPDGRLIFVPGLGIEAAFQAPAGVDQRSLHWQPGPPGRDAVAE